jgi:hypothetical protein
MPSPPRRLRGFVRVRHVSGAEKLVRHSRLQQVLAGGQWQRVDEPTPRKRSQTRRSATVDKSASPRVTSPAEPDTEKE